MHYFEVVVVCQTKTVDAERGGRAISSGATRKKETARWKMAACGKIGRGETYSNLGERESKEEQERDIYTKRVY